MSDTPTEQSIQELVEGSGLEDNISAARLGYESFGRNRSGSTAFGWVLAETLATELERRIVEEGDGPGSKEVTLAEASVNGLSSWVDAGLEGRDPEAILLHRIFKLSEESGELASNLIGALGANPRKGVYSDMDAVKEELLDVAVTALGAYAHIEKNDGKPIEALFAKLHRVAERAGVLED